MKIQTQKRSWFQKDAEPERESLISRIRELEYECVLMERYLSSRGKEVATNILEDLSGLSVFMDKLHSIYSAGETIIEDEEIKDQYNMALSIHNRLSVMTTPANAISIKYTEYTKGFFLKRNRVVNSIIIITTFCLVLYILFKSLFNFHQAVQNVLLIITASGLGAGFYTLSTVRKYLISRTYDPRYNPTYLIRFFLGITAGSILAFILSETVPDNTEGFELTFEGLAVVGGFAADAVSTILKRISEILITTIQGTPGDSSSNEEMINQEKNIIKQKANLQGIEQLTHIKTLAVQMKVPQELVDGIDESIQSIEKS
ncbi:MAG: hypothetical protein PVF73_09740 [Bacteroidales bacterium]|jgi:hypothetical protein